MGYENVVVDPKGIAGWEEHGYKQWTIEDVKEREDPAVAEKEEPAEPAEPAADVDIKEGDFPGSIDEDFFVDLIENEPESVRLIDVRSEDEFQEGHIPHAERMDVDEIRENLEEFEGDQPIVLICATGARSGEAYFLFQDERPELDVFYLDATVSYEADGSYTIE